MKCVWIVPAVVVFVSTPTLAQGPKEQDGGLLGGIVGGILGNVIPGGNSVGGQIVRQLAPTIGTVVGSSIGAQFDEEDRQSLARATQRAFGSGSGQSFKGKSGVRGSVKVTANSKNSSGQPCRTIQQEVVLKNGNVVSDTVSGCKTDKGWQT